MINLSKIRRSALEKELERRDSIVYQRRVGQENRARLKFMNEKCKKCAHTRSNHDPGCKALDAAGDICECENFRE